MEAEIVSDRLNRAMVTEAILTQSAVSALLGKEGQKAFKELVELLTDGG